MKILKYILLLILLVVLAFVVYLTTQEGLFSVTKSKVININKASLFHYVSDYQNWYSFYNSNDTNLAVNVSKNAIGIGSTFSWNGTNDKGVIKTVYLKENDSIAQKVSWNGIDSNAYITFKDTVGGTKVTWSSSGKMNFIEKLKSSLFTEFEDKIGFDYENKLTTLEKILVKEISTYSIDLKGIVDVPHQKFIKYNGESTISDFYSVLQKKMPILQNFIEDNNIKTNHQMFVVFDTYDVAKNKVKYSIASVLQEIIYTTPESEFTVDSIQPHQALKISLKGDYSHRKEAWDKGYDYLKKNNFEQNYSGTFREVYVKNRSDVKQPSQWVTEIYIPVKQQITKPIREISVPSTSTQ
jgi:effector-binding domain-containing protein